MTRFKQVVIAAVVTAAFACAPLASAAAHGRGWGYGHPHSWGFGRGLFGAVASLATLPIAVAATVVSAAVSSLPGPGAPAYAVAPAYYPAPGAYYPRPTASYYPAPRPYYAPQPYLAPRPYYAPRPSYYGGGYAGPRIAGGVYPYPH